MLQIETKFPDVYSPALLIDAHQALPCKIIQNLGGSGRARRLLVSLTEQEGAAGTRRVTLADLITAAPLSAREEATLKRLERELAGADEPDARKLARHEALRHRHNHAQRQAERARRIADR